MRVQELKQVGVGLDQTMNWGWKIIEPFSRLTLWALTGLFRFDFVGVVLGRWPAVEMVVYVLVLVAAAQSLVKSLK